MNIVLLAGGLSMERDVSLSSSKKIYQALKNKGNNVVLIDIYLGFEFSDSDDLNDDTAINKLFLKDIKWDEAISQVKEEFPDINVIKSMERNDADGYFGPNVLKLCRAADVVFLGLHGEDGENGKVQAAFDLLGITYTGNDYLSSAVAMDKALAKDIFVANNISTPKGISLKKGEIYDGSIPYPVVVKTCNGGSSVGVYMVDSKDEINQAIEDAFTYDEEILIEEYVKGREFSIGVIEGKALPIIEIEPKVGFYDYKNKYQAGNAIETCPACLSEDITLKMQVAAEAVFKALKLSSYARMDFLLKENGDFYCLEANTLPGMTDMSLLPQEARVTGIEYEELCEMIVSIALKNK